LKLTKITAEADSLKAVLEMKSEELRNLRADKLRSTTPQPKLGWKSFTKINVHF